MHISSSSCLLGFDEIDGGVAVVVIELGFAGDPDVKLDVILVDVANISEKIISVGAAVGIITEIGLEVNAGPDLRVVIIIVSIFNIVAGAVLGFIVPANA